MKTNFYFILFAPFLFAFMSACSSTPHTEHSVTQEAKLEAPVKDTQETHAKLIEILNMDSSLQDSEKQTVIELVNHQYAEYSEIEQVTNQKKTLLMREYMKNSPDRDKIHQIRSAILKNYKKMTNLMMDTFDLIAKKVKLHPETVKRFQNRVDLLWPLHDR
jgi:hypothetical protein